MSLQRERQRRTVPAAAATTTTQTTLEPEVIPPAPDGTLRLRGAPVHDRRVVWAEDVVDNEGLGRKSSKVCCIYHKPRAMDESSDDSSDSDSSSDRESDSAPDSGAARPSRRLAGKRKEHDHKDAEACKEDHKAAYTTAEPSEEEPSATYSSPRRSKVARVRRRSPNAYEKVPKTKS